MGIWQTINENPAITAGVTGAIIVAALIVIILEAIPHHPKAGPPGKLYYTDDDGKTYFADLSTRIPPFDHNGKQAVLAYVYKCGQTGTAFVGYELEYTPDGVKRMQESQNQPNRAMELPPTVMPDTMVKKPGAENPWVSRTDNDAYMKVTQPTCPDGGTNIYPVLPDMTQP